jgi:hypothetical protein
MINFARLWVSCGALDEASVRPERPERNFESSTITDVQLHIHTPPTPRRKGLRADNRCYLFFEFQVVLGRAITTMAAANRQGKMVSSPAWTLESLT